MKRKVLCLSLLVSLAVGLFGYAGVREAVAEQVYCGMPKVTLPTNGATASGILKIKVEGSNDAGTPWAIAAGTTAKIRFKIAPEGTLLGDASNTADAQIHEWRLTDINALNLETDVSGLANGNYTLGINVSYTCPLYYSQDDISYWPTLIDWWKIPITIANPARPAVSAPSTTASPSTPQAVVQAEQNLEQIQERYTERERIVEELKVASVNETYVVNKPEINNQKKEIKLTGKVNGPGKVYLYIFSDLIKAEVTADKDGNWSYVLNTPLAVGNHDVYAAIKGTDGKIAEKSPLVSFTLGSEYAAQPAAVKASFQVALWVLYVGIAFLVLLLVFLIYLFLKIRKKKDTK